jgi:hypothetical protein
MTHLLLALSAVGAVVVGSIAWLLCRHKDPRPRSTGCEFLNSGPHLPLANCALVSGLTLREAEDLLDWLEQHGYEGRSLKCESEKLFAVEFRVDSEHPFTPASGMLHMMRVKSRNKAQV